MEGAGMAQGKATHVSQRIYVSSRCETLQKSRCELSSLYTSEYSFNLQAALPSALDMFFLCIHEELALFSFPEEQQASVGKVS